MSNKLKLLIQWLRLVNQVDYQKGQVRFFEKKKSRLYRQVWHDMMDYGDKTCLMCEEVGLAQKCDVDCPYRLIHNLYVVYSENLTKAKTEYNSLVTQRDATWQELTRRKSK